MGPLRRACYHQGTAQAGRLSGDVRMSHYPLIKAGSGQAIGRYISGCCTADLAQIHTILSSETHFPSMALTEMESPGLY